MESISRPFRWKQINGIDESPINEQPTWWNHRLVKGLPVLPMLAGLKGPDAWKRTSRSWPLTQSRITTCHRGNRHRRCTPTYGGTRERKEDEKKKRSDRRIDIGFSPPFEVGKPPYVISSSWSEQSWMWRDHTLQSTRSVRVYVRGRRVIVCCVYPSFRGNRTICRRFVNAATFFVIPSPPPPMTMEFFSPLFYSLSLCLLIFHYPLYSPAQNRGKNRLLADSTRPRVEATANHRGIDH